MPHSVEDVKRYGEIIQYPCLVKPSQGAIYHRKFKRKMTRVENLDQMISAYQEATDAGFETMLQELIPGDDSQGANYNSYFYNGEPLIEFTAQKVRNGPPGLGAPRVLVSKHVPEVLESGRKILKAMGFYGFSCIEFKKDIRDGVYKVMDINPRYNMSGLLALRCGINFPWINYKHSIYGEIPTPYDYRTGVYWIDDYRDPFYSVKSFFKEHYSLSQYLKPYRSPHVFAFSDKKDPKPFFLRGISLISRAF
jgi:D-aspartate ligase